MRLNLHEMGCFWAVLGLVGALFLAGTPYWPIAVGLMFVGGSIAALTDKDS